jgi:ABC-type multidrug transport system ATPase subunit
MTPVIATEQLSRRFGRLEAVHDLTLHVPAGSIFGLIGPNGAGKTTTLKVLMNIIRPTAGRAEVLGVDSRRLGPPQFARIGYVSENQRLPTWMTVRELLAYCRPFYPTWDEALGARLLSLLDVPPDRPLRHLSRGMRMKAALVSSLAYRPTLLILDEPFSGLDPLMRDEFVQGMLELAGEGGWSAVISSHDLDEIERLIDWVGYLRQGRLAFSESTAALQARFRQIDVTAAVVPSSLPPDWLDIASSDRTLRFVHARYVEGDTERDLHARFPGASIQVSPLSLRDTFIALARQDRTPRAAPDRSWARQASSGSPATDGISPEIP